MKDDNEITLGVESDGNSFKAKIDAVDENSLCE